MRRRLAGVVHRVIGVLALWAFVVDFEGARGRERVWVVAVLVFLVVLAVGLAVVTVGLVDVGLAVAPASTKTLEEHIKARERVRERESFGREG